VQLQLRDIPQ